MSYRTLRYDVDQGLARIVLHRPDAANALDLTMAEELFAVSLACAGDQSVRAVLLTGEGKMFCAGGDLKAFAAEGERVSAFVTKVATLLHAAITRFAHMDAPLVVGVNGTAAGAGFSLALSGDYILTSSAAKFVSAYTASGLSPDGSSTFYLAKHIGLLRAKELMLTNRVLTAEEALSWGLVSRVVAPEDLLQEAEAMARQFAEGATKAYGATKQLLLRAYSEALESQIEAETRHIADLIGGEDGQEGMAAFLAKAKPSFKGR